MRCLIHTNLNLKSSVQPEIEHWVCKWYIDLPLVFFFFFFQCKIFTVGEFALNFFKNGIEIPPLQLKPLLKVYAVAKTSLAIKQKQTLISFDTCNFEPITDNCLLNNVLVQLILGSF